MLHADAALSNCPAGAVKLGQKLCKADGTDVQYPKSSLPSLEKCGREKWDLDYKDNNRINCYDTGTSPCKTACPAHIAVQGYLKLAAQGKYTEALELIKRDNPFPAVCGRICNRRCEDACTRGTVDQAVAIDEVKRFIAQQDLDSETRFVPSKVIPKVRGEFEEKIAIIGGGPAGLSCAYYLAVKGYKPTVFEKEHRTGGMLMNGIPSFRLEKDIIEAEINVLHELGVEFRCGIEVGKDVTVSELREQGYKGFYVAIGLQSGGSLEIPGSDANGVMADIDSTVDAEAIAEAGARSIQIHTGGMCHLDAGMTEQGLDEIESEQFDLLVLENVGNLVCPAEFDTGAVFNMSILSVPEGHDKPLKYPLMYEVCKALVINKVDVLPYFDFDMEKVKEYALMRNPDIKIFTVSAATGEGFAELEEWLKGEVEVWNR